MGSNLKIRTEQFQPSEDHTWLGSAAGTEYCNPATLDAAEFLTLFPTGIVPSGVVLYRHSAGLYRPFAAVAADETQTITRTATGGTFTIEHDGKTTDVIDASAAVTAAVIQAALDAADLGDIVASGAAGGPFTLTFGGQYADSDQPLAVVDDALATGGTVLLAAGTDGGGDTETAAGHLFTTTDLGGTTAAAVDKVAVPLFWGPGEVIVANLPTNHGLTDGAKVDLKHIHYV